MQDLPELLKAGCHFCKKTLTLETAKCGIMQIRVANTEILADFPILFCEKCGQREMEADHGSEHRLG